MPKSPLDRLFDDLKEIVEDTAREFLKDVNKEAKRTIRRVSRVGVKNVQSGGRRRAMPRPEGGAQRPTPPPVRKPQVTLYDHLEVSSLASPETISAAFRSLSARFHPDNQKTGNAERYKQITAAWTVLKNPEKRKEYDRSVGLV